MTSDIPDAVLAEATYDFAAASAAALAAAPLPIVPLRGLAHEGQQDVVESRRQTPEVTQRK